MQKYAIGFCLLLVTSCGASAIDPESFDPAVLTEPVACESAFNLFNPDSTVSLGVGLVGEDGLVFEIEEGQAVGSITFGEDLGIRLCADLPGPGSTVDESWPLVSGRIELDEPIPTDSLGGGGGVPVSASATGLVAETPSGELVDVGDLQLVNDRWGFQGG